MKIKVLSQPAYCFLLLIFLFFGSSCSYNNTAHLLKFPKSFPKDSLKTVIVANSTKEYEQYKIKPFDVITVRNLQDATLLGSRSGEQGGISNYKYTVTSEGMVTLPVIGEVKIAGLTREGAKNLIQSLYEKELFKNPIIEFTVNSLKVTLLGAFKAQGNYVLENENYDLIDLIGQAGGIDEDVNIKTVRIIRGDRKHPELIMANLNNINTLSSPKLKLQDGDIIIAEKSKFASFVANTRDITQIGSGIILLLNGYIIYKNFSK
ncbi:MAG: polysaccharide biosynthesis/export family protein [Sphingobacteriales bacterium]|nr:polysaccharide biosynthesis/export family protein [Sphingobacteriales bacterium]